MSDSNELPDGYNVEEFDPARDDVAPEGSDSDCDGGNNLGSET